MKKRRVRKRADLDFGQQTQFPPRLPQNSFESGQFINQKPQFPLKQQQQTPEIQISQNQNKPQQFRIETQINNNKQQQEVPYPFLKGQLIQCQICSVLCPRFTIMSLTFFISILFLLLYIAISTIQIAQIVKPQTQSLLRSCTLYKFLAKYTPIIKVDKQYYRIILPFFYHSSIAHLIVNIIPITLYGYSIQHYFRAQLYIGVPFAMVISGLFSSILYQSKVSVTASAFTYQILGLQALFIFKFRDNNYFNGKMLTLIILYIILLAMGMLPIFTDVNVDFTPILTGFIVSLCLGIIFWPIQSKIKYVIRIICVLLLVGMIISVAVIFDSIDIKQKYISEVKAIKDLCKNKND